VNDADLVDLLQAWCGPASAMHRILVDNPGQLYGFDGC
jgi:predicted TIM-barrel fold metal-dependent hydrolase